MMIASTCYQGSYYISDLCARCFPFCTRKKPKEKALYFEELMSEHPELQMEYANMEYANRHTSFNGATT